MAIPPPATDDTDVRLRLLVESCSPVLGLTRVRWLVAAGLTAAFVAAAGGPAEARRATACAKVGTTVTATKYARVFRQRGRTHACRYRTGRRFLLGGDTVHNVRLAGRYVGYSRAVTGAAGRKITVRELRRGRVVHDARAAALPPSLITDLRLKRNGSVAWIAQITPLDAPLHPYGMGDPRPNYEVRKADRAGKALLDRGREVAPGSLRISRAAYWVKAARVFSARLR